MPGIFWPTGGLKNQHIYSIFTAKIDIEVLPYIEAPWAPKVNIGGFTWAWRIRGDHVNAVTGACRGSRAHAERQARRAAARCSMQASSSSLIASRSGLSFIAASDSGFVAFVVILLLVWVCMIGSFGMARAGRARGFGIVEYPQRFALG